MENLILAHLIAIHSFSLLFIVGMFAIAFMPIKLFDYIFYYETTKNEQ